MARPDRLRLLLSDDDAHQVRQWLGPLLARKRAAAAARARRRRQRLLATLWLIALGVALMTRYF
ncbi:hypothetical protein ACTUVK_002567 [Stenotrophomonas rhizophila]|jgi:hypothetical protein|uniref:Transmembrane protein n=1 Tax=Stenotrophomonas nematodicola TaxID=2656746 RepID=A0ABW7D2N4_9GAMM|nr:hypothetical protein [Stenotrophomonas sp. BIGb0135]MCS4235880.1 hypothetical protein [Stenotrophomonas sp. BIGb0135]